MTPEERAYAAANVAADAGPESRRRLSPVRVIALFAVLAAVAGALVAFRPGTHRAAAVTVRSSFLPYVDVTATPAYPFEDATRSASANMVLGFVVSSKTQACTPSWGGAYSLDEAATSMDLDRRIARLRQRGGHVVVSFGGVANSELATGCTDPTQLAAAYAAVVRRYSVDTIDLDIEGAAASAPDVSKRRAAAIATLQRAEARAHRSLSVWLTLPVDPSGLSRAAAAEVSDLLAAKVELAGVNALTMDYGQSLAAGTTLAAANTAALTHVSAQLRRLYGGAGSPLSAAQAWQHVGATPMIGQNDVAAERFTLADARALLAFAQAHRLRRLSMWSINRDQSCGPNYANVSVVSVNCSGVEQAASAFTTIFARFRAGIPASVTPAPAATASGTATSIVDDPATSPYAIWNPDTSYPAGTKIVWHRNVYQAKWWSQGDTPDAPVAAASDTPWTLIGPVLPGEHPQPTPTLSAGTFPVWSETGTYRAGDRVMYEGVGYQAKWYTHGDVPGIAVRDAGQTPWKAITTG